MIYYLQKKILYMNVVIFDNAMAVWALFRTGFVFVFFFLRAGFQKPPVCLEQGA